MSPSGIPAAGIAVRMGAKARTGRARHDETVARRVSSGTAGPFSPGIMIAAEK